MNKIIPLTILLTLLACRVSKTVEKPSARVDYRIALNDIFVVELASNPSTGYQWHWANEATAPKVKMVKSHFVAGSASNRVGVGGIEQLSFKGVSRGTAMIELIYIRPWEKGAPPAKKVVYKVEVH